MIVLLLLGCNDSDSSSRPSNSESTYDAQTASAAEKWNEFRRLATEGKIPAEEWPTTRNAAARDTRKICNKSLKQLNYWFSVTKAILPKKKRQQDYAGRAFFVEAYCPDRLPVYEDAWFNPKPIKPEKSDINVKIKVREKQCFGSAGCNVVYQIEPSYTGITSLTGKWDVTYRVIGGESGPQINTFNIRGGRVAFDADEIVSTPSSSTVLRAEVVRVDKAF